MQLMRARFAAVLGGGLLATVHVACFDKPDAPLLPDDSGTGSGSGSGSGSGTDAATVGRCTSTMDDFNMPASTPCGDWGGELGTGATSRTGMELSVQPAMGEMGGCATKNSFKLDVGASLRISRIATGGMPYNTTFFTVSSSADSTNRVEVSIEENSGSAYVRVTCFGGASSSPTPVLYSPSEHQWFRVQRNPTDSSHVDVLVGANAGALTQLPGASCSWLAPTATVFAQFGVTASGAEMPAAALFDDFNTNPCPPQ